MPNAAYETFVDSAGIDRHGESTAGNIIHDLYSRRSPKDISNVIRRDWPLEREIDRLAMSTQYGNANARGRDRQGRFMKNLSSFIDHLAFFRVISVGADLSFLIGAAAEKASFVHGLKTGK